MPLRPKATAMNLLDSSYWVNEVAPSELPETGHGHVALVGAGPGDPELLTLKAAKALRHATAVLYDHLVSDAVLALIPEHAERIYVGKEAAKHTLPQADIIDLMIRLARTGHRVVRLKGGDGSIFGRGGEEAGALARAGVPFTIVPGITSAQGASAATGIALTHRDHAASLVLATGHLREGKSLDMDWATLARPRQTVVLYMAVGNLPEICHQLIGHGMPADTPAAIVENATLPSQRCLVGTVHQLPALAREHDVRPPALFIIGHVVAERVEPSAPLCGAALTSVHRNLSFA